MKILSLVAALAFVALADYTSAETPIIPENAVLEVLSSGYHFVEGPALAPDGSIYFSDIPDNSIHRYDPATGRTTLFARESGGANGLMFASDGEALLACAGKARRVYRYWLVSVATDLPNARRFFGARDRDFMPPVYQGQQWNSPNDLVVSGTAVYFTDPRYGNRDSMEMQVEGVYAVLNRPEGESEGPEVRRLVDDLVRPNGIGISPDFETLYVADNGDKKVWAYPILEPGKVGEGRLLNDLGDYEHGPDGMTVDHAGRIYTTIYNEGVLILSPAGQRLGFIETGPQTTNCTFGADGKTLYVTADKSLKRVVLNTGAR